MDDAQQKAARREHMDRIFAAVSKRKTLMTNEWLEGFAAGVSLAIGAFEAHGSFGDARRDLVRDGTIALNVAEDRRKAARAAAGLSTGDTDAFA